MLKAEKLTSEIIGSAIDVHRELGPGLLESVYEECFCYELGLRSIEYQRQIQLPVNYKGHYLDCGYRMDVLVEDTVIVEIKAVDTILPVHKAQLLTYMKLSGKSVGLLINFHEAIIKDGLIRMVL